MGVRFGIFNIPTIYLMREGRFYEYPISRFEGKDHIEYLLRFALQEYSSIASNNGRIPSDVTSSFSKLWRLMQAELEDTEGGLISLILMKDSETGETNYKAILIIYVMPLLTCFTLCFIKCCRKQHKPLN